MTYKTYNAFIMAWGRAAWGKLKADNIDPGDLAAVEASLSACCGGRRLFLAWREYRMMLNADIDGDLRAELMDVRAELMGGF